MAKQNTPPAPESTETEATKAPKAPKGSSVNARAKAVLKQITDLLVTGQKVSADILKTAADLVAEFPMAGSGIDSSKPLAEQLSDVQAQIKEALESYKVENGKVVEDDTITERLRILTDKKRRINVLIKKANAPKGTAAGA